MAGLDVPRCAGCGAASSAKAFDPVDLECGCGHRFSQAFGTGGEVEPLDVGWADLIDGRRWLDGYRDAAADGQRVVAGCPDCSRPVALALDTTVTLSCDRCGSSTDVQVADALLDAVPSSRIFGEPWGGRFNLSWTPELRTGSAESLGCPSCGASLPDGDGRIDCPHCTATVYATLACGTRFLPGVSVEGRQDKAGVQGWMPINTALDYYARLLELATVRRRLTRQSFLGVGLLAVGLVCGGVAMFVAAILAGPKAAVAVFGATVVLLMAGMAALMARLILGISGATKRLGLDGPPPISGLR
jgi:hypothetical protein